MAAIVIPVVAVMIAVVMTPRPVFLLFLWSQFSKVPVTIPMSVIGPSMVVDDFISIPVVIVRVVRIVHAIIVMFTSYACQR